MQREEDLLANGQLTKHLQEGGRGASPVWGDEVVFDVSVAEFGAHPLVLWEQTSCRHVLGAGHLPEAFCVMLSSMRPKEKAAFLLDLRALSASPAWLFAGEFERVDVERVRVEVVLREILPSEALDLCQQTFGCEASAVRVTLRRPASQPLNCAACAPAEVELELELADSRARRLSQRRMRCKQGCLPDAVELALPWLGVGQRCELSGRLDLERLAAPEEAACLRVLLLARGEPVPLEEVEQQAKVLFKAKRFLPALLLLTAADHPHASQAWLRRRCHCELRLGLAAAAASTMACRALRPSEASLGCCLGGLWQISGQLLRSGGDLLSWNLALGQSPWLRALDQLGAMSTQRLQADDVSFITAIAACSSKGRWETALMLSKMTVRLSSSPVAQTAVMGACAEAGRWQLALELLQGMERKKLTDAISYSVAVDACAKAERLRSLQKGRVRELHLGEEGGEAADHVGALYNLGRLTRGRGISESKADWERHDAMQLGLQDEAAFAQLLEAIQRCIPGLDLKGLSRVLMGLGDTHEDLPFGHAKTPSAHLRRVFGLVDAACDGLLAKWEEATDDRDLGFPLFALSRLGIYKQEVFDTASGLLAAKLGSDQPLPKEALRQWLLACNSVSHSLVEHQGAIAAYRPAEAWAKEEPSRLHQLAGALVSLPQPDPLLAELVREVARRPVKELHASKAVALYGLQAVRLLGEAGQLGSARLPPAVARELDRALERKSRAMRRSSRLEAAVGQALAEGGFQPRPGVVVRPGLSADFACTRRSASGGRGRGEGGDFFVEVDGPSHFCVQPFWRLRGRTVLKQRLFAAQGRALISVPYWVAAPPGAYARRDECATKPRLEVNQQELEGLISEQLEQRKNSEFTWGYNELTWGYNELTMTGGAWQPKPQFKHWAPAGLKICWLVVGELDSELGVSKFSVEERGKELPDFL
ncbi:unnamed protein product [Effrenium voratum]|nr:unnamed protein product [Effrenium voratum]